MNINKNNCRTSELIEKFFLWWFTVDLKVSSLTMTGYILTSAGECKAGQVEEPQHLCIDHPS